MHENRCAQCEKDCAAGERVQILKCDEDEIRQKWIFSRCSVRPRRNQKLCLTAGVTRGNDDKGLVELHHCEPNKKIQYFETFNPKAVSKKFQFKFFKPSQSGDLCLTQEHHPWPEELLRFTDCKRAKDNDPFVSDDTSHWVVGKFDGHP